MHVIKDIKTNKYLTKKQIFSEYTFTNNINFAYTYEGEKEAQSVIEMLDLKDCKPIEI